MKTHLFSSMLALAGWRVRQMWQLLLLCGMGMLAILVLVCSIPLFSEVATSASLQDTLRATAGSQTFEVQAQVSQPSVALIRQVGDRVDQIIRTNLNSYVAGGSPQFSLHTPNLDVLPVGLKQSNQAGPSSSQIVLNGYALNDSKDHLTVAQGRLPQSTAVTSGGGFPTIEIALTQFTADNLGVHVGSLVTAHLPTDAGSTIWMLRIVGIFSPMTSDDPFWQDSNGFQPRLQVGSSLNQALTSSDMLLSVTANSRSPSSETFTLSWIYHLDVSNFNANDIGSIMQQFQIMQQQIPNSVGSLPAVQSALPTGPLFEILPQFAAKLTVAAIPVTALMVMVVGLLLLFVGILSDTLIDGQTAVIMLLCSRGASRRMIFGAFVAQSIGLGMVALLSGPLLAVLLIRLIVQAWLPLSDQSALSIISQNPLEAALHVGWFALLAAGVAVLAMIVSINRASGLNVLTFRRETSRQVQIPLWQRMKIDVIASLLVLAGYIEYIFAAQSSSSEARALLGPLSLAAPLLLVIAAILLFLRLFPFLLRVGTSLAARSRGASTVLALAQMDRTPRAASRMILLLTLATAFTLFTLTLIASQEQRVFDGAAFRVGSDFSGYLPVLAANQTFAAEQLAYQHIPGVSSVTLGYRDSFTPPNTDGLPVQITAVDATTFAQTAIWTKQDSTQPLSALMALLVAHRADALSGSTIYAVVDASLWNTLHLSPGEPFTMPLSDFVGTNIHFIAAAEVQDIPGIYDGLPDGPGFLVDYQSYASVFLKDTAGTGALISPNYLWLRAQEDGASLSHVRNALTMGPLQVTSLLDRHAIIMLSQNDPLQLTITGVFGMSVIIALIFSLVGSLVTIWLDISKRLTNFAVLRALGMSPSQIAAVLAWEYGIIFISAIILGLILGILLIGIVVPVLIYSNTLAGVSFVSSQNVPPLQEVIPIQQLALALGLLMLLYAGSLSFAAAMVSRPSLSQTLRLNED